MDIDDANFEKKPNAYNHRDVLGIKELHEWNHHIEQIHLEHNRILQEGFMYRDPREVLADAKMVGANWITDFTCPSANAGILLHIAKELVVNYKVEEKELNIIAHRVRSHLLGKNNLIVHEIEKEIQAEMTLVENKYKLEPMLLDHDAVKLLNENKISQPDFKQIEAAKRLYHDVERKNITNKVISKKIKELLTNHSEELELKKKNRVGRASRPGPPTPPYKRFRIRRVQLSP